MIRFALKCADGHAFDSWFQSGEAFDKLAKGDLPHRMVIDMATFNE